MMFSRAATTTTVSHHASRFGSSSLCGHSCRPLVTGRSAATTSGAASAMRRLASPSSSSMTGSKMAFAKARSVGPTPTTLRRQQPLSDMAGLGGFRSTLASFKPKDPRNFAYGVAGGLFLATLHSMTGSENEFYEYRYKTHKSADDLASFYGGEELMELFCIFPLVGGIMMRSGTFDEEGNVHTMGVPGEMIVSMVFSDEANEETGDTEWFNKRERFRDNLFGWTCWDMVCNFGFRTLDDGTLECYHYGEYFHGNLPVISQVMKFVFKIHAKWFAWSVEHHVNHFAFTAETEEEEHWEEESRSNMPLFLLKHYALSDLLAYLFGYKNAITDKEQTFMVKRRMTENDDEEDIDEDEDEDDEEDVIPVKMPIGKLIISGDIAADREATKLMLRGTKTDDERKAVLARNYTLRNKEEGSKGNAYAFATEAAKTRHMTRRATRHMTRRSTLPLPRVTKRKTTKKPAEEEDAAAPDGGGAAIVGTSPVQE